MIIEAFPEVNHRYNSFSISPDRKDILARLQANKILVNIKDPETGEQLDKGLLDMAGFTPTVLIKKAEEVGRFNIEMVLGKRSRGLIAISFNNYDAFQKRTSAFDKNKVWQVCHGDTYIILLRLADGEIEPLKTCDFEVKNSGTIPAPTCIDNNGEYASWVYPVHFDLPTLTASEVKNLFPEITINKGYRKKPGSRYITKSELAPYIYGVILTKWDGRSGTSRLKALIALIHRADAEDIENFRATDRETALLAGMSKEAFQNARNWLVQKGYISRVPDKKEVFKKNHYRINKDKFPSPELSPKKTKQILKILPILNSDAFSWGGLNPSGAQIYCILLLNGPMNCSELTSITGRGKSTINKSIVKLSDAKFILKNNDQISAISFTTNRLEKTAIQLGVDGRYKNRRKKYHHERALFYKWNLIHVLNIQNKDTTKNLFSSLHYWRRPAPCDAGSQSQGQRRKWQPKRAGNASRHSSRRGALHTR